MVLTRLQTKLFVEALRVARLGGPPKRLHIDILPALVLVLSFQLGSSHGVLLLLLPLCYTLPCLGLVLLQLRAQRLIPVRGMPWYLHSLHSLRTGTGTGTRTRTRALDERAVAFASVLLPVVFVILLLSFA